MKQYEAGKVAFYRLINDMLSEHKALANWERQAWVINYYVNKELILYIKSIYFGEDGQIDNLINAFKWYGTVTGLIYLGHAIFGKDAIITITEGATPQGQPLVDMVVNNANALFIFKEATAENDLISTAEGDYIRVDDLSLATSSNVFNLINKFLGGGVKLNFAVNQ